MYIIRVPGTREVIIANQALFPKYEVKTFGMIRKFTGMIITNSIQYS